MMPDLPSFDEVYREHHRKLVVSLRLATGSAEDAQDLAQEAFARTLVRWDRVRQGSNPAGYVYRVAFRLQRRSLRTHWWRQGRLRLVEARARLRPSGDPGATGEALVVREVLATLPPACRRAAILCLYAEMTAVEAAAVLGIRPSTVRTHLQRARAALTAGLSETLVEDPGVPVP